MPSRCIQLIAQSADVLSFVMGSADSHEFLTCLPCQWAVVVFSPPPAFSLWCSGFRSWSTFDGALANQCFFLYLLLAMFVSSGTNICVWAIVSTSARRAEPGESCSRETNRLSTLRRDRRDTRSSDAACNSRRHAQHVRSLVAHSP